MRLAKAFTLLATFYANVFIFVTNLLLAFAIFPREYSLWVFLIFYTVSMLIQIELGWIYDYEIIDITDELQIFESRWLKCITVEWLLRWSQVTFNGFTLIYFITGVLLNP